MTSSIKDMHPNFPRSALLALLSALVLALSACGGDDEAPVETVDLGPDPAAMVPADAPFYTQVVLRPQGSMATDLNSALSKLLATDDPGGMIRDGFDAAIASDPTNGDISYNVDIEPWLGTRAGIFVTSVDAETQDADGAAVVAVTDVEAAQRFIEKAAQADSLTESDETYGGVEYKLDAGGTAVGIDGEFLLAGTEQGFKDAVDAGAGDSIAENPDATSALDDAPEGSLFSVYVDTPALIDLVESSSGLSREQIQQIDDQVAQYGEGPIVVWGTATDSTFAIAASTPAPVDGSGPSELISSFPAESWFAFASAGFGEQLQNSIDQFQTGFQSGFQSAAPPGINVSRYDPIAQFEKRSGIDLKTDLAWIGDAGGFVEGTSILGLGAGLVLEATDERAAFDTLGKIEAALQRDRRVQISPSTSGDGFQVSPSGSPIGAEVTLQDGNVVAAIGAATADDVLSPAETLDGSERFILARDALGAGATPSFFLDFAPVVALIEGSGQVANDPSYRAAQPYLTALDYLVSGSIVEGDRTTGSIVLGVKEGTTSSEDTAAATITP